MKNLPPKEEMQSLNELQTVNLELQTKVSDLVHASNDMKNLLNSTEIASSFHRQRSEYPQVYGPCVEIDNYGTVFGRPLQQSLPTFNIPK